MPDPSADGTVRLPAGGDKTDAARKYCTDKIGPRPGMSDSDRKAAADAAQKEMLKIAKCYRDNGVDVADPTAGGGITIPTDVSNELNEKCGGHPGQMNPVQP